MVRAVARIAPSELEACPGGWPDEVGTALLTLTPPVATAAQARDTAPETLKRAYTSVLGLGWITSEYFHMLLGTPGVKADAMVERFVNAALADAKLNKVDNRTARELLIATHTHDPRGADLTAFEHAIWRTKGALPL